MRDVDELRQPRVVVAVEPVGALDELDPVGELRHGLKAARLRAG
ncbi:MAG: hypothetical protein M5U28_31835 [Sandaracinaceae bacterium]|nr:hypothetical protein [Sandaracinaceae bacterium]